MKNNIKNQSWSRSECETGYTTALSCAGWGARAGAEGRPRGQEGGEVWLSCPVSQVVWTSQAGHRCLNRHHRQDLSRTVIPSDPHSLVTSNRPHISSQTLVKITVLWRVANSQCTLSMETLKQNLHGQQRSSMGWEACIFLIFLIYAWSYHTIQSWRGC